MKLQLTAIGENFLQSKRNCLLIYGIFEVFLIIRFFSTHVLMIYGRLSVLFKPCHSCSSLVTFEVFFSLSVNKLNDDAVMMTTKRRQTSITKITFIVMPFGVIED